MALWDAEVRHTRFWVPSRKGGYTSLPVLPGAHGSFFTSLPGCRTLGPPMEGGHPGYPILCRSPLEIRATYASGSRLQTPPWTPVPGVS
jgi:hypothetical protein